MPTVLATYTFGDSLLTVLEFAILFLWIWVAVGVVFDIFRSHDLSNWGKALWMLFIIVVPYIGVLAYLIVRGHTMHEHREQDRGQAEAFQRFEASGGASRRARVRARRASRSASSSLTARSPGTPSVKSRDAR